MHLTMDLSICPSMHPSVHPFIQSSIHSSMRADYSSTTLEFQRRYCDIELGARKCTGSGGGRWGCELDNADDAPTAKFNTTGWGCKLYLPASAAARPAMLR